MGNRYSQAFVTSLNILALLFAAHTDASAAPPSQHLVGMYVHEHWPYNHPYAARTWTMEDWRGYADGLKRLGFNTIMIWPMLEFMPDPPTSSDVASLEKHARVIAMLHKEFGMRAMIVLCPNVAADNPAAAAKTFETRHFFWVDRRVNPADKTAIGAMLARREKLLRYFSEVDGVAIIDSDPGGYPGSTNAEFIDLLAAHRQLLDRIRPGIELVYWMHAGWEAYSRFYTTGKLILAGDAEHMDAVTRLKALNPEPWGMANGLPYAKNTGVESRVISFNYGRIEAEPSLPMTNFGGNAAWEGGHNPGPRGVMGNAQTHCVQLPNTFAFARGAAGKSATESDYVNFGNDLIAERGSLIVDGWKALSGTDPTLMRAKAADVKRAASEPLTPGPLRGLLFGDPRRFMTDLASELELKAAYEDFLNAVAGRGSVKTALQRFASAADEWQRRTGYQDSWHWPGMEDALRKLNSPGIDQLLNVNICIFSCPQGADPNGYGDVKKYLADQETFTPDLIKALKETAAAMRD